MTPRRGRAHHHRRVALALAVAVLLPSAVMASTGEHGPYTWRLLNTFIYQGVGWGQNVLNMEAGEANAPGAHGQITVTATQPRTWVASPVSPHPVDFGTATWTLEFGGTSVVPGVSWTVGVYEPGTETFTPAAGEPAAASGPGRFTFTPAEPFTLPAGANLAVHVTVANAAGAPAVVDTWDEQGERSPSSLSVAGGQGLDTEVERAQARVDATRCHHRDTVSAEGCAEEWVTRAGPGPDVSSGGAAMAVSADGEMMVVTGSATRTNTQLLDTDVLTQALDAQTGALLWEDRYAHPSSVHDFARRVVLSSDGATAYVVGSVCVAPTEFNCTSNYDGLVIAYDSATGTRRWLRTFGGAGRQEPSAVAVSPDGSTLLLAGYTAEIAGPLDQWDVFAAALDAATGEVRWQAAWAGAAKLQDYGAGVAFAEDGATAFVVGATARAAGDYDALILTFDTQTGQPVSQRLLGGPGDDRAAAVAVRDGLLYVAGAAVPDGRDDRDAFVLAHDLASAEDRWQVWHDGLWGADDNAAFLQVVGDSVYVGGSEAQSSVILDVFVASYEASSGAPRWSARFDRPGRSYDGARGMAVSPDGRRVALAVESGWFSNSTRDYLTLVYDAASGDRELAAVYDGTGAGGEVPTAVGFSPDASRVYVTGASQGLLPSTLIAPYDRTTVAYRLLD